MRKISLLVLCFIVFSLLLTLPAGCYAKTSTILFSTWHDGDPFPSLELEANTRISQYIYDCSVASGYTSYNWAGSETTENHIYDAAVGVNDTYSISFFIGHGATQLQWNGPFLEQQYWIYDSDGNRVYDREIYPYSDCKNVRFIFLWGCKQGDRIGGTHWSGTHYGMPNGWLHTTDLSNDGYASPDNNGRCFIGFHGEAPSILWPFYGIWATGYYFLGHFYAAALCGDMTINEALDYASQEVWQVNFGESMLYNGFEWWTEEGKESGKMVVYGDGNLDVGTSVTAPTLPAPPPKRILTISTNSGGGTTNPVPGTYEKDHGSTVTVTAVEYPGYDFDYWHLDGEKVDDYPITVTMDYDHALRAYFWRERQPGAGGCPTLFVWDGSQHVEEATLDIHADSDVTLQHTIEETLVPDKNSYKLSLRELDNFTSHIDQVKLYAVDSDGEMYETHLTNATHSDLGDVKEFLLHDDETRVDMTPEQTIDLKFTVPNIDDDVACLIFEINGYNQKTPGGDV